MEKEYLSQRGIELSEKDVIADEEAMKELVATGYMTTPVTVIDGEIVVGFDVPKLERLLVS